MPLRLNDLIISLEHLDKISFQLPNGDRVPGHFHVTEVAEVQKKFIDCGGKLRQQRTVSLQLLAAHDYDHRLHPEKLIHILKLAQRELDLKNRQIRVEYQGLDGIVTYALEKGDAHFQLVSTHTACLAGAGTCC